MLTEQNKIEIYEVLTSKFKKDLPYTISEIGRELTLSGNGCRKYSYSRMKEMLQDAPEFIEFIENTDASEPLRARIISWEGPMQQIHRAAAEYSSTTSDLLEAQNELGGGILIKSSKRPDKKDFTEEVKKQVYELLRSRFSVGNAIHMASISKCLIANGYAPRNYGYSKMKNMLSTMSRYLSMQDVIINQVPNVLITILPSPRLSADGTEEAEHTPSEQTGKGQERKGSLPELNRHEPDKKMAQERLTASSSDNQFSTAPIAPTPSNVRSSSGSVRFSTPSTGNTFKADSSLQAPRPERRTPRPAAGENSSTFDRLVYMPPKVVDFLSRKGMQDPLDVLSRAYQKSVDAGTYEQRADTITFPVDSERSQESMIAILKKNERPYGKQWYLTYVGFPKQEREAEAQAQETQEENQSTDPSRALEAFADLGYLQEFLRELANEALPERWDTSNRRLGRYYVLKKYIQLTFYKLQKENKICISANGRMAAFNTGLLNAHYDDIYACFVPSKDAAAGPAWRFEGFISVSSRNKEQLLKDFNTSFDAAPPAAVYAKDIMDLYFDPRAELDFSADHLLLEDLRRLPAGYLKECAFGDESALGMIEAAMEAQTESGRKQANFALSRYLASNDRLFRRLKARMEDAVYMALKRTRNNLRDAAPIYSLKTDSICQAIPLCLEEDSRTDSMLVIKKGENGHYQAQMVLQPDNAYLYARLLGRTEPDYAPFGGRYGSSQGSGSNAAGGERHTSSGASGMSSGYRNGYHSPSGNPYGNPSGTPGGNPSGTGSGAPSGPVQ